MNRLRECRMKAGFSQKEVAITLGVAAPSVANWERGKTNPTHDNLLRLADLYHVTADYLLGRNEEIAEPPDDLEELREQVRRDPERRTLYDLARYGEIDEVRQAVAILDALKKTKQN